MHASSLMLQNFPLLPSPARTENLNLQCAFLRHLEELQGIHVLQKVKVESIQPEVGGNRWPLVHLSDGTTIRARPPVSPHLMCNLPSSDCL